jgi:hypothetical protein
MPNLLQTLESCQVLRIPHYLDNRLTDDGEVVSLTHRPHSNLKKYFCFCLSYSFLFEVD